MEFRKREVKPAPTRQPVEPPFTYIAENGKEIKIPMEEFKRLPQDRKDFLYNQQRQSAIRENRKSGDYPAKPGYAITVVVENCEPKDLDNVSKVKESCPAKMPLHEDYRLPVHTYIARYFILNGDEQKKIENHWLSSIPSVQFKVEVENGITEVHRRSIIDGKYGERMETQPAFSGDGIQKMGVGPQGANMQSFNPRSDMHKLAKPCASCGKNRYSPQSPA